MNKLPFPKTLFEFNKRFLIEEVGYKRVVDASKLGNLHKVFSNLKSWLIGTHHGVSPQHLPAYLNEYTFRFNRRVTPMAAFQSALGLTSVRLGPTYKGLTKTKTGEGWKHPNPDGLSELVNRAFTRSLKE